MGLLGMKSLGSGFVFDFFDTFDIPVSNVKDVPFQISVASYISKVVFVYMAIRVAMTTLRFKRKSSTCT
jgi:hypothetical protein